MTSTHERSIIIQGFAKTAPFLALLAVFLLGGCGSVPQKPRQAEPVKTAPQQPVRRGGGYYMDDGPGDDIPANLDRIPDAIPRVEPYTSGPNRPYTVFGKQYVPDTRDRPFTQRGIASWYGRKFHGQKTSSGEIYDMYAMTAAHPTLPIPSYVRITNPANGNSVIVRINDRGPFLHGRIVDLSYAAAYRLGYVNQGSAMVELERLLPADIAAGRYAPGTAVARAQSTAEVTQARRGIPSTQVPTRATDLSAHASGAMIPTETGVGGYFLQLGAFGSYGGAEEFLIKVAERLQPSEAERLRIVTENELHRVRLGPYADRAQANSIADLLAAIFDLEPFVVAPK